MRKIRDFVPDRMQSRSRGSETGSGWSNQFDHVLKVMDADHTMMEGGKQLAHAEMGETMITVSLHDYSVMLLSNHGPDYDNLLNLLNLPVTC